MSDVVIRIEGLGKRYRIGARQAGYRTLRETVTDLAAAPVRSLRSTLKRAHVQRANAEHIWALKDVSFEVKRGEVVGIIGRNGAGKSTLLKILSRITEPTEGRVELRGRVGSLLEVGTGFHPELTGRENIYLNGAILGMRRAEIEEKFDEIVAFAEIAKFLDTPVKHYSSGMYVRLAFAVAAHLEPEILLVDEVLAVGDAQFQKKCLGKMQDVAGEGRTVLFVSHNMGAVRRLCPRAMLVCEGGIQFDGTSEEACSQYLSEPLSSQARRVVCGDDPATKPIAIREIALVSPDRTDTEPLGVRDRLFVEVSYEVRQDLGGTNISLTIKRDGVVLFRSWDSDLSASSMELRRAGRYVARVALPHALLAPGTYTLGIAAGRPGIGVITKHEDCLAFELSGAREDMTHTSYGRGALLMMPLVWDVRCE